MKKVAIIGSGIAGVATAHYLGTDFDITIFEKNEKPGGHVDTHWVDGVPIDAGFIMFNERKYPLFIRFLKDLGLPYAKSQTSFAIDNRARGTVVKGASYFRAVLSEKSPWSIGYWRLIRDGGRFRKLALKYNDSLDPTLGILDYLQLQRFSRTFIYDYFLPMMAGLMSESLAGIETYPMKRALNFLMNHGLLCFLPHWPWLYVKNGYQSYIDQVIDQDHITLRLATPVLEVSAQMEVCTESGTEKFDHVVMACEADVALKLLASPTKDQSELLSVFKYKHNHGYLHTDDSIVPGDRSQWGAHMVHLNADHTASCFSIWCNPMLELPTDTDYFMTLNPWMQIDPEKIIAPLDYRHLSVSPEVLQAQKKLHTLNENGPIYFAGAYFKYFHEDAMRSAFAVAKQIKAT